MAEKGRKCPFLNQDMSKVCHKCPLWINVRGSDPNTGKEVDEWGCSIAWLPHLLIENANQTRQAGAATESFRNEMVKASDNAVKAMFEISKVKEFAANAGSGANIKKKESRANANFLTR